MPGQLHQMNMEYSPSQDRLVLKLSTTEKEEARLYFTRRFTKELWDALMKILEQQPEMKQHTNPEVKKAMMAMGQARKTKPESFEKKYESNAENFPLGENPSLVTGFQFQPKSKPGGPRMVFMTDSKQQIGVPATEQILYSFAKLLAQATSVTGWGLSLEMGFKTDEEAGPAAASGRVH